MKVKFLSKNENNQSESKQKNKVPVRLIQNPQKLNQVEIKSSESAVQEPKSVLNRGKWQKKLSGTLNSIKLINEKQQFQPLIIPGSNKFIESIESIEIPQINNDCLVIGVIGQSSVGKSTLLNSLFHLYNEDQTFPYEKPFKKGTKTSLIETMGVDIAISVGNSNTPNSLNTPVILLDSGPIFSSSLLSSLKNSVDSETNNYEDMIRLSSLQIGLFLLSSCHIVLVVDDNCANFTTWEHIKTLEMLKWQIPDISEAVTTQIIPQLKESISSCLNPEFYSDFIIQSIKSENLKRENKKIINNQYVEDQIEEDQIDDYNKILEHINFLPIKEEYLSSFMFIFNKCSPLEMDQYFQKKQGIVLSSYFSRSKIISQNIENQFCFIQDLNDVSQSNILAQINNFINKLLSLPLPTYKKPIGILEWISNSQKMWEIVLQSTLLLQYNENLKTYNKN